jgi:hypothetical protein
MSDERWTWRAHGLLRNEKGHVLVITQGERVELPFVEVTTSEDEELPSLRDAFVRIFGARTVVVRSVGRSVDEEGRELEVGLELESLERIVAFPPGVRWLAPDEVSRAPLPRRDRELLDLLFVTEAHPLRPPWAQRGWFAEAAGWIERALDRRSRRALGPVEQLSNWCISSILRVQTEGGFVYFKATASSPLFVDEGAVTRRLADLLPDTVPHVLANDSERRWMLVDDFGPVVGWSAPLETRVDVLSSLGRIQLETTRHLDELLALGLFDRRPAWLASELGSLLARARALGLGDEELEQLGELVPMFAEACERLAAGPVPATLVHGDLHPGNVAGHAGRYVVFDWTDACVSHPFLDLLMVVHEEDADARRTLRDGYLDVWKEFAPTVELLELWRLAEPLASLNQAISYRSIVDHVEPGTADDLEAMIPYWLRKALAASRPAPS